MIKRIWAFTLLVAFLAGCEPSAQNNPKATDSALSPTSSSSAIPLLIPTTSPEVSLPVAFKPPSASNKVSIEEISDQSFDVEFESWGKVRFVSAKQENGNGHKLLLRLMDANGNTLYTFPQPSFTASWSFQSIKAVSFQDGLLPQSIVRS